MTGELTAIVERDGDWWIGWIEEVPGANAQERSEDELLISLRAAAQDIIAIHLICVYLRSKGASFRALRAMFRLLA